VATNQHTLNEGMNPLRTKFFWSVKAVDLVQPPQTEQEQTTGQTRE